jgi:protein-export membrane protein SecD
MNQNVTMPSKTATHAVRVFRALAVILFGCAVSYFVYVATVNPESLKPFKYGLDLAGGSHLVFDADLSDVTPGEEQAAMNSLREVIERRINVFGVSEPIVQVEKSSSVAGDPVHRLVVELPGVTDVDEAVKSIGKTPLLEFKLVNAEAVAAEEALEKLKQSATSGAMVNNVTVNGKGVGERYLETGLTGRYIERAQLVFGNANNSGTGVSEPIVQVSFNKEGDELFTKITTEHTNEQLAIFLDGALLSDPVIREPITGGTAIITGNFTAEEARELVRNLNFGALPVPITLSGTQSIGAALGEEALHAGVYAGIVGFLFLSLFMIVWYRLSGVVSVVALAMYVVMMLALFKLIPVVLTAAGIAGFILSVGLAVDANILIAERIKEELAEGKDLDTAITEGFSRAWLAIRDSNIAHIIAGVILFWFGTALIKGFALVFSLGVVVSMLSAITISRTLLVAIRVDTKKSLGRFLMGSGFSR